MKLKIFNVCLIILGGLLLSLGGEIKMEKRNHLVELVDQANKKILKEHRLGDLGYVAINDTIFKNLSPEEVAYAMAYWMFDRTGESTDPSWVPGNILRTDDKIKMDVDVLRSMLGKEEIPRNFYCLSQFTSYLTELYKIDFISQKFRMLFRKSQIARNTDQMENPTDLRITTYNHIMG